MDTQSVSYYGLDDTYFLLLDLSIPPHRTMKFSPQTIVPRLHLLPLLLRHRQARKHQPTPNYAIRVRRIFPIQGRLCLEGTEEELGGSYRER